MNAYQWWILVALASLQFLNILDFIIVMPLGPRYLGDMKLTADQFGYVVASYGYASFAAGIFAAGWINRSERRITTLALFALFAVSSLLCFLANDFPSLILARCATGACGGLIGSIVLSIVSDVFPEERRGFALGVIMTSFSMASIFGVPIGLGIARWSQSPQTPFLALALACIPIWGILFFTLPRISHSHDGGGAGYWLTLYEVVRRREHQIAFLFNALLVFQTFLIVPYLATYCVANVGISEGDLQYVYIVGGACTLVSMPLVGRIADRFGKPRVYGWVAISAILPALLMTHLPPVATWACVATTSLYMVFSSARMVPGQAMISNAALPAWRPGFLSVSTSIQALATGLSASMAANIVREREDGRLEYFWLAGWLGASFYLLSLLLVPALKRAGTSPGADQTSGGSTSSTGGIGQPKASEITRSNSSSLIVARRSNAMHSENA